MAASDGCMVGMKSRDSGMRLKKPWKIATTLRELAEGLDQRLCIKDHLHGNTEWKETALTAYYPEEMVDLIWHGVNLAYPVASAAEADIQIQDEALPREFDEYVKRVHQPGLEGSHGNRSERGNRH